MTDHLSRHRERFDADPNATTAFELLEEQAISQEHWETLAGLYRRRADATALADDPRGRARILLRLGRLLEERMRDDAGAIEAYQECARLDGGQREAWQGLRRLYAARGSWDAVLQVAEVEAGSLGDPRARAQLYQEMGDIWQRQLADAEQAEHYYTRARYERDQAPAEVAPDPAEEAHAALVQSAWIAAARGDSVTAVSALREALEGDPANVDAIDMLVTVLEGAERHAEVAELLERRAALATDATTRGAVLSRLGLVREEQLSDMGGARSAYERALEADPKSSGAQAALVRIYRLTESWSELRRTLEVVGSEGSPEQRVGALCQLGMLLERQFDDAEAAVSAFEEALALEPDHPSAKASLARLRDAADEKPPETSEPSAGENRAVRIVGVLERKLERLVEEGVGVEEDATRLRLRLAELRSATLDDPTAAIEVLEPCLEDDAALGEVAQRLALLYERTGRHEALVDLSRKAAAIAADPAERAEWYRRAAETARSVGQGDLAVELFRRLLDERPGDRHAEAALQALHRNRGDAEPLCTLLRRDLSRAAPRDELPIHLELAQLLSGPLEDDRGALFHWRRALAIDPSGEDALEEALHCADAIGGAPHQLDLLDHLVSAATAREDRARLLMRRGDLMVRALGWAEEGAESWRRSLELDPDQPGVRSRLESLPAEAGAAPTAP
jgi:tetratricopeptide (TPR) repeat protein